MNSPHPRRWRLAVIGLLAVLLVLAAAVTVTGSLGSSLTTDTVAVVGVLIVASLLGWLSDR